MIAGVVRRAAISRSGRRLVHQQQHQHMENFQAPPLPERLRGLGGATVWAEFTPLAVESGAYNLGQGFPDWSCPEFCKDAVAKAALSDFNQYARGAGHLPLVKVLAEEYGRSMGRTIDPLTEVTVTSGATGGMFNLWQGLLSEGDEVILMEPAFDIYAPQVQFAGGKCAYVPLRLSPATGEWKLDIAELEAAITPKTRAILINTPHNPTGKVFTREELESIADIFKRHPKLLCVTDEVYEHIIFDGKKHVHMASMEGMWDRTVTVSSSGKTFSTTGWKIGWVIGPDELVNRARAVNAWIQYSVANPLQQAVADSLVAARQPYGSHPSYYAYLVDKYQRKRDALARALRRAGMSPMLPEGGIFIVADTSAIEFDGAYMSHSTPACEKMTRDWAFCRWLTIEKGVAAIPPSAFYKPAHKSLAANLARFAFCKQDETIEGAAKALEHLNPEDQQP